MSGTLDYKEITSLASRLYDGRAPEEKDVRKILKMGHCPEDKIVNFDDLFNFAKQLKTVFDPP